LLVTPKTICLSLSYGENKLKILVLRLLRARMEADMQTDSEDGQSSNNDPSNIAGDSSNGARLHSDDRYNNPPHLGRMRQRLFDVQEPIELSDAEFKEYWPYVDNVWVKQRSTRTSKDGDTTKDYFMCRLKRPSSKPREKTASEIEASGKKSRKKRIREGGTCQMGIRIVRYEGAYPTYVITRVGENEEGHTHDLDHLDKIKRNSRIMAVARRESTKGFQPSSVHAVLQEDYQSLVDAGGKFLSTTDVRNVSQHWRAANPDVELKIHEGYESHKGLGVIRVGGERGHLPSRTSLPTQVQVPTANDATPAPPPPNVLQFPIYARGFLQRYLPEIGLKKREFPHVTLTYASSLDSMLSLAPGTQTLLSGPESKAMTHYLRCRHDAILVGVGTVLADDPGLNCRLEGVGGYGGVGLEGQPRPIVIDPIARWKVTKDSRILKTAREGRGKAPWIVVSPGASIDTETLVMLKNHGGNYLRVTEIHPNWRLRWEVILRVLAREGIRSVMVEGGGTVMSELLNPAYTAFINSIIVTIAPTYLGRGGVFVSPDSTRDESGKSIPAARLQEVRWQPMGDDDVVMCGKLKQLEV
jgi:2,5-diamino-6-(ribosylamino)-4(3H)-pyrimidinone 5'-phosphate reductase